MFGDRLRLKYPKYKNYIYILEYTFYFFVGSLFACFLYLLFFLLMDMHVFIAYINKYFLDYDLILRLHIYLYSKFRSYGYDKGTGYHFGFRVIFRWSYFIDFKDRTEKSLLSFYFWVQKLFQYILKIIRDKF